MDFFASYAPPRYQLFSGRDVFGQFLRGLSPFDTPLIAPHADPVPVPLACQPAYAPAYAPLEPYSMPGAPVYQDLPLYRQEFMPVSPVVQAPEKPQFGPQGSNIFIFYLPNDITDLELLTLFSKFGRVLSSTIIKDLQTGRSRGFGFVSFDNPVSSQLAIRAMNGVRLRNKVLKVQLKRESGSSPPPPSAPFIVD